MNKLRKLTLIPFVFFFIILVLSGCWDEVDIEDRGFVVGIAIDVPDGEMDNQITVMNQFIIPSKLGGIDQKEGAEKQYVNLSVSGNSLFEITQKASSTTSREPFYEHTKIVVLSEDLAKKPGVFESLLDGILRDRKTRRSMRVFISKGKASDILEIKPETDKSPAMYIDSLVDSNEVNLELTDPMKLGDLHAYLLNEDGYVLNYIVPTDVRIESKGVSVFDGYTNQMVGTLNIDETKGFNLLTRDKYAGIINFNVRDYLMAYSLDQANSLIEINADDPENIQIDVHIKTKGSIAEMFGSESLLNESYIEEIEEKVNERIVELVTHTIEKAQKEFKVDFLRFAEKLRRKHYDVWEDIENDWDRGENFFSKSDITVSASSEILSIGPIDRGKIKRDE